MRSPELHPNPENATLEELRVAMDAAPNKRSYVRLNAIRSLLMGIPRVTLCRQFCRTDRMELRAWCADPKVELWFGDECGVEGDLRPRRRWVQPGKPRRVPYLGDHI